MKTRNLVLLGIAAVGVYWLWKKSRESQAPATAANGSGRPLNQVPGPGFTLPGSTALPSFVPFGN